MNIPSSIRALTLDIQQDRWESSRGFVMREIPAPVLDETASPTDALFVILKMHFAGLCGSDRGIWRRDAFSEMIHTSLEREHKTMRILGHEFYGEIVAAGSMVEPLYGLRVGDRVTGDSHVTCGNCFQCRIGQAEVCQNQAILGISIDGIFAEYVKLPARNMWKVRGNIRPEICSIFDPMGNGVHALSKVDVRGKRIAIFGCGQIGLFSVALARRYGATQIIGVDTLPQNLEIARRLGAHETIDILRQEKKNHYDADEQVVGRIMQLTGGRGVDVSFEMAGFNSSVNNSIAVARPGGEVILFGIKDGDMVIPHFSRMVVKGLTIHNVIGRQLFATWQTLDEMLADKKNGLAEVVWNDILQGGTDTMIHLSAFTKELLEERMERFPKLVFDMQA